MTTTHSLSISGRPMCNLLLADDIYLTGELQDFTDRLVDRATAYGMEVRTKKIMTKSADNISADISLKGQTLEEVTSLGATPCKDGTCLAEFCIRITSAVAAMDRLNRIRRCNTISFASKFKLCKSLVTSIFLYDCETWTLLADPEEKIQAFETKGGNFFVSPTWSTRPTTGCEARSTFLWVHKNLKIRTLAWFGHVTRRDSLSNTILQGT